MTTPKVHNIHKVAGFTRYFEELMQLNDSEVCKIIVHLFYLCHRSIQPHLIKTLSQILLNYAQQPEHRRPVVVACIKSCYRAFRLRLLHIIIILVFVTVGFCWIAKDLTTSIPVVHNVTSAIADTFLLLVTDHSGFIRIAIIIGLALSYLIICFCWRLVSIKALERKLYKNEALPCKATDKIVPFYNQKEQLIIKMAFACLLQNMSPTYANQEFLQKIIQRHALNIGIVGKQYRPIPVYPHKSFKSPQEVDTFLTYLATSVLNSKTFNDR